MFTMHNFGIEDIGYVTKVRFEDCNVVVDGKGQCHWLYVSHSTQTLA